MAAHLAKTMTKILLDIDTRPLASAIERSKRKTMTHIFMTHIFMTYIAEALVVVLMLLLGAAILAI